MLALGGLVALATPASAVSQAAAESTFRSAGITGSSSGGCSNPADGTRTAFEGLRQATVDGAATLRDASGCAPDITGGTETGTDSHANGHELDLSLSTCLSSYVTGTLTSVGTRSDGAAQYRSGSGHAYVKEGKHWDVRDDGCGGC